MARLHADLEPKLPRQHLSVFTWIAFVTIAIVLLALIAWGLWFAGPTILR